MRYQLSLIMDGTLRLFGCHSIKSQFAISAIVIMLLAFGSSATLYLTLSASADTVNLAGRQRMLSQRLAKETLLVAQNAQDTAKLEETIALFENSHRSLMVGNPDAGILPPANDAVKNKLSQAQSAWLDYKSNVENYLATRNASDLSTMNTASLNVLNTMNEAVGLMAQAANSKTQILLKVALAFSFATFMTAAISHFLGMHWLMAQIVRLRAHLAEVAKGNFSRPISEPTSDNEVAEMFSAYNRMIQQVGTLTGSAKSLSQSISQQTQALINASRTAASNTAKQNKEIEQVATAMNEMSATIREVSDHAHEAERNANEVAAEAGTSQTIVDSTFKSINHMSQNLNDAVGVMQELDRESQEIGNVLTVITSIAEQTNLLALNAAIEAARAGEQGRGFAVVADEVRTLAQRTQESTEEIETIIQRLQNQARKAVNVMETSTHSAQSSSEQISETKEALAHVVVAIEQIHQMSTLIATATQQQAQASNEIDSSVNSITSATAETAQIATDVQNVSEKISHDVISLNDAIAKLKTDD